MIRAHRLNGQEVLLNAELFEWIEAHGQETVIGLVTGNRVIVQESVTELVERCLEYRRTVYSGTPYLPEFLKKEPVSPE